ncbi:MAG: hypothetical protein NC200_07510 [Candidatus Gastranaerophilales bacterium]|nr:hypothetical protein [Candidatus Gastranaerophilales bacterium]
MANNYQNINIGTFNSAGMPVGGNFVNSVPIQPDNADGESEFQQNTYFDSEYQIENPSHSRLNALDSTLLESEAYQSIDDEVFKTEYRINKLEVAIKSIDKEIENAKSINDFQKADVLLMRKHSLQNELKILYANYGESDVTTKLSGSLTSMLNAKPTILSNVVDACTSFLSNKILPKISKNFSSGKNIKSALSKLETLNKNVDELVTMQTPYGEADERYDRLTNYLNRANVIHFQISKTIGSPTFFDTISSIDKEKFAKTQNKSNFGNMTKKPPNATQI